MQENLNEPSADIKNNDQRRISVWKEYLPFVTIFFIGFSTVKYFVYYTYFKVPITEYLSLSDVGFILVSDLVVLLGIILWGGINLYLKSRSDSEINIDSERKDNTPPRQISLSKLKSGWRLLIYFVAFILFMFITTKVSRNYEYAFWTLLSFFGLAIFSAAIYFLNKSENKPEKKTFYINIAVILLLLFAELGIATNDISTVTAGKTIGTTVYCDDTTYISTKQSYYIGKTHDFVFIYDTRDATSIAIPIGFVKKIKHTHQLNTKDSIRPAIPRPH